LQNIFENAENKEKGRAEARPFVENTIT